MNRTPSWLQKRGKLESGAGRTRVFSTIRKLDRDALKPYPVRAHGNFESAKQEISHLVRGLGPDAVDEGTATTLDPLIVSWTAGTFAAIDQQYIDNLAAVDRLLVAVEQQLVLAKAALRVDQRTHEFARLDYEQARLKLGEIVPRKPAPEVGTEPREGEDKPL